MKFKLIIFLFISVSLYGNTSFISGFLNDNYTGTIENGISGKYIGADDFLTFSLFTVIRRDNFKISVHDQIITSRKYDYRFDLFSSNLYYSFKRNSLILTPYFGIIYRGNLGGEVFQNIFHNMRDLPPLYLEYTDPVISPVTGIEINLNKKNILLNKDKINFSLSIDIPFGIKPMSETLYGAYVLNYPIISFEFLAGHKYYFTDISQYSDFVRTGGIFGAMAVIKIFDKLSINSGCFFFPSKNLENDPLYMDIDHSYSPQFWIGFGLNGDDFSILDIINF